MAVTTSLFSNSFSSNGLTSNNLPSTSAGTKDVQGIIKTKNASSWGLQVKDPTKVDTTRVGDIDSSMVHPAIRTISSKPMMMLEQNKKRPNMDSGLGLGRMVDEGFVYRQKIYITSYEIGPDRKASLETIMNYLQETCLNHFKTIGLWHDGYGLTPKMCKKNLIWVITKTQMVVDRYPIWGDVIQIDTWKTASGKNGMCCNWTFCDCKTGEIIIRASSTWVMMNKETRRLSKFPDEVRAELAQYFVDSPPIVKHDTIKSSNRDDQNIVDHVSNGLTPRWSDLDLNQHVSNVKYIGWILESIPKTIMENYELASMALEYRRECKKDTVLQSHTSVIGTNNGKIVDYDHVDCQHLLQLEIGGDSDEIILKGQTRWRRKDGKNNLGCESNIG